MVLETLLKNSLKDAIRIVYGEELAADIAIDTPPDIAMGDFAVGCFSLSQQFKKSPVEIAASLVAELNKNDAATHEAVGPYINIRIRSDIFFQHVCEDRIKPFPKKGKTVMVEYLSPNTNKPLHLGHMRNGVLGMAVSSILDFAGYDVVKAILVNDRGIHICKSMIAWLKFADGLTPEKTGQKGDHFVGDYYVLFSKKSKENPELLDEARDLLKKWEEGDAQTIALWNMMNSWVYAGFAQTYEKLGFSFDVSYYESALYQSGKDIVTEGLRKGIFNKQSSGAISVELPEDQFGLNKDGSSKKLLVLREDGTSVYATQDIAVAVKKSSDYPLDASIYVVGDEQQYYFKTLFYLFKKLGYAWADHCYHLSYGMVVLPDGKMKSREGTVVDADDLLSSVVDIASEQIRQQSDGTLADQEVQERAEKIGIGAIKFNFLKAGPKNEITFNPQEAISFEGFTGPYIQYAFARAMNILKNAKREGIAAEQKTFDLLGNNREERVLAQKIALFSNEIEKASLAYDPSILANVTYELAKSFHQFYNKHQVVMQDSALASQRLALVTATAETIKLGLDLLGIAAVEEM